MYLNQITESPTFPKKVFFRIYPSTKIIYLRVLNKLNLMLMDVVMSMPGLKVLPRAINN